MDEAKIQRVRFRAWRRGFREADLILGPFADRHARAMTDGDLGRFEDLLDQPDPDLYAWVTGGAPVPPAFDHEVMARLRAFLAEVHLATTPGAPLLPFQGKERGRKVS